MGTKGHIEVLSSGYEKSILIKSTLPLQLPEWALNKKKKCGRGYIRARGLLFWEEEGLAGMGKGQKRVVEYECYHITLYTSMTLSEYILIYIIIWKWRDRATFREENRIPLTVNMDFSESCGNEMYPNVDTGFLGKSCNCSNISNIFHFASSHYIPKALFRNFCFLLFPPFDKWGDSGGGPLDGIMMW